MCFCMLFCRAADGGRATLLLLDRADDLLSPLMHEFTYQCLVEDLLGIKVSCQLDLICMDRRRVMPHWYGASGARQAYSTTVLCEDGLYYLPPESLVCGIQ